MATRQAGSILVGEMVVGAYTQQHLSTVCLRRRRCSIDGPGVGWLPFSLSPPIFPQGDPPGPSLEDPSRGMIWGLLGSARLAVGRSHSGKALYGGAGRATRVSVKGY